MSDCPCGSGKQYKLCCGPFIASEKSAPTPEALMRSRYSAYVHKNLDYIMHTATGPAKRSFNAEHTRSLAEHTEWLGLKVLHVSPITTDIGFVEFMARFSVNGKERFIYETSEFHKENGKWYYFDGESPKIGRNDPCPCGSGKKYKKCCGAP